MQVSMVTRAATTHTEKSVEMLWFKFYFPLFLGMVMYDEFKTKENKISTKGKIEPQQKYLPTLILTRSTNHQGTHKEGGGVRCSFVYAFK